jgi:hypothetical protein
MAGKMEFFEAISRIAIVIIPKKPFYDWLNSIEPGEGTNEKAIEDQDNRVYLIPDFDDQSEIETYLKKVYQRIFKNELASWYTDESLWPKNRTWEMFREWFDINIHTIIYDTLDEDIEKD